MILTHGVNDSGHIVARFDPHDGHCHGQHDVIVVAMPTNDPDAAPLHVTLGWNASALLSIGGTREFLAVLEAATDFADTIRTANSIGEASRMVEDLAEMLKDP